MSSLRPRRSLKRVASLAVLTATCGLALASSASAQVKIVSSYTGPITNSSPCTAEPRGVAYGNTTYVPNSNLSFANNVPAIEDVQPRTDAGAHSDYCIAYSLTPDMNVPARTGYAATADELASTDAAYGDDQKRVVVDTPEGFAGSVSGIPTCTEGAGGFGLTDDNPVNCPAPTQLGDAQARLSLSEPPYVYLGFPIGGGGGAIYNLPASPNEAARLGVVIRPGVTADTKFVVRVVFTDGSRTRLRSIVDPAPRMAKRTGAGLAPFAIYVESIGLRLWGEGGAGSAHPSLAGPFAETGTQCGVNLSGTIDLTTYGAVGDPTAVPALPALPSINLRAVPPAHQLVGCGALPFDPSVAVTAAERAPGVPTAVTAKVSLGQSLGNAPLTALLRDASITLPPGLELGAQVGTRNGGLGLCTAAQFAATSQTPAACPATSRVGSVRIDSPLTPLPIVGSVYLGPQRSVGELPDLYLDAGLAGGTASDAPRVKVAGSTTVGDSGAVTATFKDNPQLRFSALTLNFDGGPSALFVTPRECGTTTSTSSFVSWAGGVASKPVSLTIDQNCARPAFAPTIAMGAQNTQAGASSPTTVFIGRGDGQPWLDSINVALPTGFLANLKVPTECPLVAANAGNCPESSRIGVVDTVAGAGTTPLTLSGKAYLTERDASAVAGITIVVRAKIGDLDLGDVVVPGRIDLRPTDAGLNYSATVPTRFRGIALNLRSVALTLDRAGFPLNPSACGPLPVSATIVGDGGQTATPSGQVGYTGCGALGFQPKLDARLTGEVKPKGHPGMHVGLNARDGDSNLKVATVLLPDGVAADLKNVQVSCLPAAFNAVACPADTKVGSTQARVSITDEVIAGDVYLVKVPGETLPGLGLSFNGRFAQRVLGTVKINAQGRLLVRFDGIPDLPLRSLNVDVTGGPKGPLQLSPAECANGTRWDAEFIAQGGQLAKDQTGLRCAAIAKFRLAPNRAFSLRIFDFGGRNLKYAKVTLPSGYSIDKRQAAKKGNYWARLTGAKGKTKFTKRSLTVRTTTKNASTLRVKLNRSALKTTSRAKRSKSLTIKVRYVFTDGAVQNQTIKIKRPSKKSKKASSKKKK